MPTNLHIKNMVCDRCIEAVEEELSHANISFRSIKLGEAEIDSATNDQMQTLDSRLAKRGFELLKDSNDQLISSIRTLIISSIAKPDLLENMNFSYYLEKELSKDYTTLSRLFSAKTGSTIEKFIIRQRIERVKELISYGELSISEIANLLGYSSVQHLSTQFKKLEGMTPTQFVKSGSAARKPLDQI